MKWDILKSTLVLFISILYYIYEGYREAYLYHYKNTSNASHKELHPAFTMQRILFWAVVFIYCSSFLFTSALIFMFSFIHDGSYYVNRNNLDPSIYKERFTESSLTSTAIIELTYKARLVLFFIGAGLFLFHLIMLIHDSIFAHSL